VSSSGVGATLRAYISPFISCYYLPKGSYVHMYIDIYIPMLK